MSLDVRKVGGFWYADGYVDLDDPDENTVVAGKIIVEGDPDMGDLAEILALAVAIDRTGDVPSPLSYFPVDDVDGDEFDEYMDDESYVYLDCTTYDVDPVFLDSDNLSVKSASKVPAAVKAIKMLAAEQVDESYRRPRRIKVDGRIYEAVERPRRRASRRDRR